MFRYSKSHYRATAIGIFASAAIFFTSSIFASTTQVPQFPVLPNNEMTLSGGLTISSLSNGNQVVPINSFVDNTYDTNNTTNVNGMAGLAYTRLFHLKHDVLITIGPALYYTNMDQVNGINHPFSNLTTADTLNYQYGADSWSLMAISKLAYEKYVWQPFITGGIGPSWNRLYNYSEVPTNPAGMAVSNPAFVNNTEAEFAYMVGCGVERVFYLNQNHAVRYLAALSYQYMNFGSAQLAPGAIATAGQAIKINTLDTNVILFTLGADF